MKMITTECSKRIIVVIALHGILVIPSVLAADFPSETELSTVLFAVGDLALCENLPPMDTPTARVAQLVRNSRAPILMAGDLAYPKGSQRDFSDCFVPVWGALKERILPVPGNHEYETGGAEAYFRYFGELAGTAGSGYFATQVGSWRVIGLNSNIETGVGSQQERWLKQQLTMTSSQCTLAFWHHPRFSSGHHGDTFEMDAIWRDLYDARVDVVISGHDHDFERFAPQNAIGERDMSHGIREFVVGTGGAPLRPFEQIKPNSDVRDSSSFGVLKLTLGQTNYSWEFIPVDNNGFRDHGEAPCHQ